MNITQDAQKQLALDYIGDVMISTKWFEEGAGVNPAQQWETLITLHGDYGDAIQHRYTSEAEALVGHAQAVAGAGLRQSSQLK